MKRKNSKTVPEKNIERLLLYRRLLSNLRLESKKNVFSHQLAQMSGASPVQVRRDFMLIGYFGSPIHGYDIDQLIQSISEYIDAMDIQKVALVGVGNLGRAILDYFQGRADKLAITAIFDRNPEKVGRVLHGVHCYPTEKIQEIVKAEGINVAIITVPKSDAQDVADRLVQAGVCGIVNYAPIKLNLFPEIYVVNRDMLLTVEKVAFFARRHIRKESLS
ncbi:MAG: redox-sensing transcriptional repressor Rex [Candidatus Marinimicrobia bacterium CG08_land_8_20_14_0_20_45_22]|nr:MAG: redox-sensing transcriptional repressor Rex [Candidatus Marinimicrobia bacterium CG08_land_8_20_14_0_20_45_22]